MTVPLAASQFTKPQAAREGIPTMFDVFLHPGFMIAGLALVSAPIIIHLINRMRFKRVRWAAMEFLLKSQKRNRRRLIIEQLILLALRCLLIALAGFLVARFVGNIINTESSTLHLVVLDDTLSMNDRWKEEGDEKKAFDVARQRVRQLAKDAATANSPQRMKVVTLSNLENVIFSERLNDQSLADLGKKLDDVRPSLLHVKPAEAVKWAREQVGAAQEPQRYLHFVSDLRDADWSGADADALAQEVDGLTGTGTRVLLLDVAHPYRSEKQPVALHHDNMGITDLRPETRFAAEGMPVQFTVTIHNYSAAERKAVFLETRVNGEVRFEATQPVDVKVGETKHTFMIGFNKPGYNQVAVTLQGEDAGVEADNTRIAVVEVRKQVPVLMVDGSEANPNVQKDSYYVATVLGVAKGYTAVQKTARDLDDLDLDPYPCVYLLNVATLGEKAIKRLEDYVTRGGRVAFFVGDKVRAGHYNEALYKNGQGLFPVPLAARPTDKLETDEKVKRLFENQYQVYLRDPDHPIFREAAQAKYREVFKFLLIDQYWPALPRFQWNADPNKVKELVTLPNRKSLEDYRFRAAELNNQVPVGDEKHEKYRPALEVHRRAVRDSLAGDALFTLGNALERLLNDRGNPADLTKFPDLKEFWDLPENQKLRNELNALRETVQYGDPLVLTNRFGKGQVVAFLTTAGRAWNDWAGGCPASWTYPMTILDLQKWLTGTGEESNYNVGDPLEVVVDAGRYEPKASVEYQPPPTAPKGEGAAAEPARGDRIPLKDLAGATKDTTLTFSFADARQPGVYFLKLQPKPAPGQAATDPEERAYVYNVDTENEGDLKRASKESVERSGGAGERGRVMLVTPDMGLREHVAPKRKDASETPWLYLVILMVLIVEQALAVHLSFHLKGGESMLPPMMRGGGQPAAAAEAA